MSRIVRTDLHNHLKTASLSRYDRIQFDDVIDRAADKLGAGGILGIINFHASEGPQDPRFEMLAEKSTDRIQMAKNGAAEGNAFYVPSRDILVVKGQEVPTKQGHVLVLGIDAHKKLANGRSLDYTLREAKDDHDAVVIVDHPFGKDGLGKYLRANPDLYRQFHGYEIYNSEAAAGRPLMPKDANENALHEYENAIKLDPNFTMVAPVAFTDGHSLREIGRSWTQMRVPDTYHGLKTSADVLQMLKDGLVSVRAEDLDHQKSPARIAAWMHGFALAPYIIKAVIKSKLGLN